MTNDLQTPETNPWEAYGNAVATRTTVGELLKFTKGDYIAGPYSDEIPTGTRLYAVMDTLNVGWLKWQDNRPAEQIMGAVGEGFQPPRRADLGDLDKTQWETDEEGHPRDPWQFSNYLVLVAVKGGKVFTFTTSSRGGLNAIGELCKVYGKVMRQQPDKYPVIELDVGSYQHSNRSYGRIKFPIHKIVDWADAAAARRLLEDENNAESDEEDIPTTPKQAAATPSKAPAAAAAKKKKTPEIPF